MRATKRIPELGAVRGIAAIVCARASLYARICAEIARVILRPSGILFDGNADFCLRQRLRRRHCFFRSGFVLTIGMFERGDWRAGTIALLEGRPRLAAPVTLSSAAAGAAMRLGLAISPETAKHFPLIWLGWFYNGQSAR